MSQIPRNLDYLNRRRIVYRRDPTDPPDYETPHYMFFENGTHQAYDLFKGNAKIIINIKFIIFTYRFFN